MKSYVIAPLICAYLIGTDGAQGLRPNVPVTLVGRVSDWQGCVLKGVTIKVGNESGNILATTTTGENGEFSLSGLQRGAVTVRAEAPGFGRSESRQVLGSGQNLWDTGLPLGRIAPGGSHTIRGRVLTTEGAAIPSATVTLLSVFDSGVSEQVRTDAEGNYRVSTDVPGQYVLTVVKCNYQVGAKSVVFPFDDQANATIVFRLENGRPCP